MAALSPDELRKRNNFTVFVNRIKTNGYFTLNEGNGQRVQITQKFAYQLKSLEDLERFRDNRNSIILPTGSTGSSSIRLSQLYKDNMISARAYDDLEYKRSSHNGIPSLGAIGCSLSHYYIWKKCVENNYPYIIAVEEDVKKMKEKLNDEDLDKINEIFKKPNTVYLSVPNSNLRGKVFGTHFVMLDLEACKNLINGFFGGMGGCAMIGQSMINIRGGARGRTSGIVAAVSMMVFIMYASELVEMIPLAALVGVMFMVSIGTFEWSSLRLLNRIPRPDAIIILVVTGITIVFHNLAIAVLVGVIIAAVVYSWNQGGALTFTKDQTHNKNDKYIFTGTLFFGSADNFKNSFDYNQSTETVVIDMHDTRVCDYSGAETLENVRNKYKENGRKVIYRNMNKQCMELVKNTGAQLEYLIE